MLRQLRNEFSWSCSRARSFDFCLRQYYWNYYGSWLGWSPEAKAEAQLAYRLKKMVSLAMWSGDVVHRALEEALRRVQTYQHVDAEGMKRWARQVLIREWFQSTEEKWRANAKYNLNLFEHYYRRSIGEEQRETLRERVFRCIDAFFGSWVYEEARRLGPGHWKTVEDLQSFPVGEIKVFVKLDFAFERQNGQLVIVDWKSGKTSDGDEDQLDCYGLFAVQEWKIPPERLRLVPAYLAQNEIEERIPDPAALMRRREAIFQSAATMRERLDDPAENEASRENFPLCGDETKCYLCQYRELCFDKRD